MNALIDEMNELNKAIPSSENGGITVKKLTALLALFLLLSCLPVAAEETATVFKEVGLNIDFQDVLDESPNYVLLSEVGIVSRHPFVSLLDLEYFAFSKDLLQELFDNFDTYSEEMQEMIRQLETVRTALASVIVTDADDPDDIVRYLCGQEPDGDLPEGAEVTELGRIESYRYFLVKMPGFTEQENYDYAAEYDMDPEELRAAFQDLQADAVRVRDAFAERVKTAELYMPVDRMATLNGQTLRFETTDLDGNPVTSAELFSGNQITMVNVWGSWCRNCVAELAELAEIHARLREKGCGIVGVETENVPVEKVADHVRALLAENGVTYPNVLMPKENPVFDGIHGFPTTLFVDSEGTILTVPISGAMVDRYESIVDQLLKGEQVDTSGQTGAVKNDSGAYRVIVYDSEGHPVEGAVIQLCDDTTCAFQPTDAEGIATFTVSEPKAYDIHVLMVPEGYTPDQGKYRTMDTWCDVEIFLEKAP